MGVQESSDDMLRKAVRTMRVNLAEMLALRSTSILRPEALADGGFIELPADSIEEAMAAVASILAAEERVGRVEGGPEWLDEVILGNVQLVSA